MTEAGVDLFEPFVVPPYSLEHIKSYFECIVRLFQLRIMAAVLRLSTEVRQKEVIRELSVLNIITVFRWKTFKFRKLLQLLFPILF